MLPNAVCCGGEYMAHVQRKVRELGIDRAFRSDRVQEKAPPTSLRPTLHYAISKEDALEFRRWKRRKAVRFSMIAAVLIAAPLLAGLSLDHTLVGISASVVLAIATGLIAVGAYVLDNSFAH